MTDDETLALRETSKQIREQILRRMPVKMVSNELLIDRLLEIERRIGFRAGMQKAHAKVSR